jgi:hypothetical protein
MFDAKPNRSGFLLLNKTQLMYFQIKVALLGSQFKILQSLLFNLMIRVMNRIRVLWKQCRSNMAKNYAKVIVRLKDYLIRNWGSPFLVGFMVLLFGSAVSLSVGLSSADIFSVYAFYALAAGVVLQLACFLKYEQKTCESEVSS